MDLRRNALLAALAVGAGIGQSGAYGGERVPGWGSRSLEYQVRVPMLANDSAPDQRLELYLDGLPEARLDVSALDQKMLYLIAGFEIGSTATIPTYADRVGAMRGVIEVVTGRAKSGCFQPSIREVLLRDGQFQPVSASPYTFREVYSGVLDESFDPLLDQKGQIVAGAARQALDEYLRSVPSPFEGALFFDSNGFLAGSYSGCSKRPLEAITSAVDTGSTTFYR